MANISNTQYFKVNTDPEYRVKEILDTVYDAMAEKLFPPRFPRNMIHNQL